MDVRTVNDVLLSAADRFADRTAFKYLDGDRYVPVSFKELRDRAERVGAGLIALGLKPGDRVLLLSDNRIEWIVSDLAILAAGGVTVPRGADALPREVRYIVDHARARVAFVEDRAQLEKLRQAAKDLLFQPVAIVLDRAFAKAEGDAAVLTLAEVSSRGDSAAADLRARRAAVKPDDLASIVYTSGTTGSPKGIELLHRNFAYQATVLPGVVKLGDRDRTISVLPPWHTFERSVEYACIFAGAETAYSKPDPRALLKAFERQRPTLMAVVPRLLEALHDGVWREIDRRGLAARALFQGLVEVAKVRWEASCSLRGLYPRRPRAVGPFALAARARQAARYAAASPLALLADRTIFRAVRAKTGGALRAIISGGSALPAYLDEFFHAVGIPIWEGYGLTETAPVVSVRGPARDVPYTVGRALPGTEIRVVSGRRLPLLPFDSGVVEVRGPGVMQAYHRDPDETRRVLDREGWLDTGDLGRLTAGGDLQITGRTKDTIVLTSGEKVDPEPVEQRVLESPYVRQAMVAGQDRDFITVLIVPDSDAVRQRLDRPEEADDLVRLPDVKRLFERELLRLFPAGDATRPYERPHRFVLVPREFRVGEELTPTLKLRRDVISAHYRSEIEAVYA